MNAYRGHGEPGRMTDEDRKVIVNWRDFDVYWDGAKMCCNCEGYPNHEDDTGDCELNGFPTSRHKTCGAFDTAQRIRMRGQ